MTILDFFHSEIVLNRKNALLEFFVLRQIQNTILLPMTLFVKLHFGETMRLRTGIDIIPLSELGP